jgi:hypothetical protein
LHCSNHFKKSEWGHSVIFKIATEDFPVLLAPSDSMLLLEAFDRKYLVEYPSLEKWLSEAEAWIPSDGLNTILMAPFLKAGRVLEFFFGGT